MPEIIDPSLLPEPTRARVPASQIIAWLLYPVIFVVGLSVGLVVGLQHQAKNTNNVSNTENTNVQFTNASIIGGNKNTVVINAPVTNATTNTTNTSNTNTFFRSGDYLKIDPTAQAALDQQKAADLETLVDKSAEFTDILRQQDLLELRYTLLTYFSVRQKYPDTGGLQIKLDKSETDTLYSDMKDFYGGTFYEKIDPQSPTYYYGYTSDGSTFTLTCYLVSKKKAFILTN